MDQRRGIAVSPGIAIGPALILDREGNRLFRRTIEGSEVENEILRLRAALKVAQDQARIRHESITTKFGPEIGDIFRAHAAFYDDPSLLRDMETRIRTNEYSAEYAVSRTVREIIKRLEQAQQGGANFSRFRADFIDLERNVLDVLMGEQTDNLPSADHPVILLGQDLTPSETADLDPGAVLALATESGGATSHTAILAGALEIPAVVGAGAFLSDVSGGDLIIIDGDQGMVIIDPDQATLDHYTSLKEQQLSLSGLVRTTLKDLPAITKDGAIIKMLGNIEFPSEMSQCQSRGAEGVGLYRTEFLYVNKVSDPTEEEHYEAYKSVLSAMGPEYPVVIRTLDIGGDKYSIVTGTLHNEKNPFLGLRSVRLCLRNQSLFRKQLRAILRASIHGNVRIMFPMVSTIMELRQCKSLLKEVSEDLEEEEIPFKSNIPIGTMIEVPSAALLADVFAKEVDFFSIGTNDLVQYTLAADRNNENVAELYTASDPSVLRLIKMVVQAAQDAEIDVTVCGEMSGEPIYTPLLVGLGIRSLSATPRKIPELKRMIRSFSLDDARCIAREVMKLQTAREVTAYLRGQTRRLIPEVDD